MPLLGFVFVKEATGSLRDLCGFNFANFVFYLIF